MLILECPYCGVMADETELSPGYEAHLKRFGPGSSDAEFEAYMLDIQTLRNDLAAVAARLATRGYTLDTAKFEQLDAERKAIQTRTQELQANKEKLDLSI